MPAHSTVLGFLAHSSGIFRQSAYGRDLKNLDRFGSEKLETIKAKASAFRDRVAVDGEDTRCYQKTGCYEPEQQNS